MKGRQTDLPTDSLKCLFQKVQKRLDLEFSHLGCPHSTVNYQFEFWLLCFLCSFLLLQVLGGTATRVGDPDGILVSRLQPVPALCWSAFHQCSRYQRGAIYSGGFLWLIILDLHCQDWVAPVVWHLLRATEEGGHMVWEAEGEQ